MPFLWIDNKSVQYLVDAIARIEQRQMAGLTNLKQVERNIMAAIDDALAAAEAAAESNSDAQQSAIGLLNALSAQIAALAQGSTDPAVTARIQALATSLQAKTEALAAAVVANTPSA